MSHNTLKNYYQTNFALVQHHKYSLSDIENMIPWERDIYVGMLEGWLKTERDRIRMEQEAQKNMQNALDRRKRGNNRKMRR